MFLGERDNLERRAFVEMATARIAELHKANENLYMLNEERIANIGRIAELRRLIEMGEPALDSAKKTETVRYD